jgi:predicted dehydrogenase
MIQAAPRFIQCSRCSTTEWTYSAAARHNPPMARYTFPSFNKAPTPRYVVLWDMHWHVLDCQRLEPAADLSGAMAATIERLATDGWQPEGWKSFG